MESFVHEEEDAAGHPVEATDLPDLTIDVRRDRYPFSIVWTSLPLITWIFPFVGHLGICTSDGKIHDFAGPYFVSVDNMAFGSPQRYWQVPLESIRRLRGGVRGWDIAIAEGRREYGEQMYNFCTNNCHNFVNHVLNKMRLDERTNWGNVNIAYNVWFRGRFVSCGRAIATLLGFFIVCCIIVFSTVFTR
eukprot:gnl/Spiro4/29691_TR14572_c0_g2_i1.p1 gnl/Spiro4/29691_TR14572_c0_g2~~gnl/Spiro4/29691_TR14572_c0_g2_i1.p1  ORF type:complete len:201 (-),score=53.11 gnl/Spiro4/29691_TR14572_c0_g2_i1:52-621(-)